MMFILIFPTILLQPIKLLCQIFYPLLTKLQGPRCSSQILLIALQTLLSLHYIAMLSSIYLKLIKFLNTNNKLLIGLIINSIDMKPNLFLALLGVLTVFTAAQTPPFWGGNPRYTVKVQMLNAQPVATWNFTYYYDWSLKAERYEHEAPQQDQMCLLPNTSFTKGGIPCTVTFATDGWSYINYPTINFCCKCTNGFGAVRYDWLQENSTYMGIETVAGRSVTHWIKRAVFVNQYLSTVDKQLPVRFFESTPGTPKTWNFDLDTYSTGPIDPSKFVGGQCSTMCGGKCSLRESELRENVRENMRENMRENIQ